MAITKTCASCGKEFSVPKCRSESATTCSRACKAQISSEKYKSKRIKRSCLTCGKEIEVLPNRALNANDGKYCSIACKNIGMSHWTRPKLLPNEKCTFYGYVKVKVEGHPFAVSGYVNKHRLVVEDVMREKVPDHKFLVEIDGRKYLRQEISVHHIDEDKSNNDFENLIACTAAAHNAIHDKCHVMEGELYPDYDWIEKREHRGIKCVCKSCKQDFYVPQRTIRGGGGSYCSVKCKAEGQKRGLLSTCLQCGKTFPVWMSKVAKGHGKFCSNACRLEAKKGHTNTYVFPAPVIGISKTAVDGRTAPSGNGENHGITVHQTAYQRYGEPS